MIEKLPQEIRLMDRLRAMLSSKPAVSEAEPATFLILVLDRSDFSLKEGLNIMRKVELAGNGQLFPPDVRAWFKSPVHGQYLCLAINRIEATSAYAADDDFHTLLQAVHPLMTELFRCSKVTGRATWAPILCPPMHEEFVRWFNAH